MKGMLLSLIAIVLTVGSVAASSLFVSSYLTGYEKSVIEAEVGEDTLKAVEDVYGGLIEDYREMLPILLLLLPDSALYEIEGAMLDVASYAEGGDYASTLSARGRLLSSLERARVMSEFSLRSVF